jgi:hypothetical protein
MSREHSEPKEAILPCRAVEPKQGVYDEASELVVGILWLIIITCV